MGADIVVRQVGKSQPVDRYRLDLFRQHNPVCLTNRDDEGVVTWWWRLVDRPKGSAACMTDPTEPACLFHPDVPGTYLIELVTTDQTGVVSRHVAVVACPAPTGWTTIEEVARRHMERCARCRDQLVDRPPHQHPDAATGRWFSVECAVQIVWDWARGR